MQYKAIISFILLFFISQLVAGQTSTEKDSTQLPVIEYSNSTPKYEIAGIKVTGANNYEDFVLIGFSGLAIGDKVNVPGDAMSASA